MKWTGRITEDISWLWAGLVPDRLKHLGRRKPVVLPEGYIPPSALLVPPVIRTSSGFKYQPAPPVPVRSYVTGAVAGGQSTRRGTTWQCPTRHMTMTSTVPLESMICYCGRSMIEIPPNPGRSATH